MNTQRTIRFRAILAASIATCLFRASLPGATFTWDGGSFTTNNWTDALNWNPNGAPDPDGNPVADNVIFGGSIRPASNVDVEHIVNTVTFNNTASAFTVGGMDLTVLRGITNDDAQTQTFTNSVLFREDAAIAADSGGLTFGKPVAIAGGAALTVSGGFATTFAGFTGPGRVIKNSAGTMTLNTSSVQSIDLTVNTGVVATNAGLTTTFGSSSQTMISGGTFNAFGSLTLDGASLSRSSTGVFTIAAGKTLTVQNGGDVSLTGSYTHDNATPATFIITGAGSTLTATTSLEFSGNSTINVTAGGMLGGAIPVDLGNLSDATVIVDGVGSAFNTGSTSAWGTGFDDVDVTYRNGANGTLGTIELALGSNSEAALRVESGADVTAGDLFVASEAATLASADGLVLVTGAGSTLTQNFASTLTLGTSSDEDGSLIVQNGGTFTSGIGSTTVNQSGRIEILGGTYNATGDITLNGGLLTRDATGVFNLGPGKTLTVQNGGDAVFAGNVVGTNDRIFQVSGAGSTLSAGFTIIGTGGSLTVQGGASATVNGSLLGLATAGGTAATVIDGSGSSLTVPTTVQMGGNAVGSSSLTFRNGATGTLGSVQLGSGTNTTTNVWSVESDADVTAGNISIGAFNANTTNTVTISGNGSTITQTQDSTLSMGTASGNTAVLNVTGVDAFGNGATFNSGTGAITVNPTGVINVRFGTFNANGDMTINGGQLNLQAGGGIVVAAGRTLTIQNGADATSTSNFPLFTGATVNVIGAGSTLSANDEVQISNGMTVNVTAGGTLHADDELEVGGSIPGTLVVDGAGSSTTANSAQWEKGNITFRNGATGTFGSVTLAAGGSNTATFRIESGADVTANTMLVSNGAQSGIISIDGNGSTLTVGTSLNLGNAATLRVQNGGAFTKQSGGMFVSDRGSIQIVGGSATINGDTSIFGAVAVLNGSLTFNGLFDRPAGIATVSAGAGGVIRFNGEVQGDGDFLGDAGLIEFAGSYNQDDGAGTANFATSAAFLATNTLTLQIGGLTAGTQHDELKFTGFGAPHVTFGGTLAIDLNGGFNPQLGQQFDLFDFDPARVAGTFSSIQLAPGSALAPGLFFSDSQLYTTGTLIVVPEPGTLAPLLGGSAILCGLQRIRRL